MNGKIRTCYISAAPGANLKVLRSILREKGIRVLLPNPLTWASNWSSASRSVIAEVDLVIGVLGRARGSTFVLFELGQAWALSRQIILFAPPRYATIPADLEHFLVIRARLNNREAISFALDQMLAAPVQNERSSAISTALVQLRAASESGERPIRSKEFALHSLGAQTSTILRRIQDPTTERDLEELVARVIRQSGVDVIAEAPRTRPSADLAIWSDALQPLTGNPLLVEIKQRVSDAEQARAAAQRLATTVLSSGALWGLLLYGEGPEERKLSRSVPQNILVMRISTLISEMEFRSFVEVIKEHRNRRVHGELS